MHALTRKYRKWIKSIGWIVKDTHPHMRNSEWSGIMIRPAMEVGAEWAILTGDAHDMEIMLNLFHEQKDYFQ